jgi:type II secretion system protein G
MKNTGIFLLLLVTSVEGSVTPQRWAEADIISLKSAVQMFKLNARMLPPTHDGLRALVERPAELGSDGRWTQIMHKLPSDPWGNTYCYIAGDGFSDGFGIYSRGADGKSATQGNDVDDISSWRGDAPGNQNRLEPWILWSLSACALTAITGFTLGRLSARKPSTTEQAVSGNRS